MLAEGNYEILKKGSIAKPSRKMREQIEHDSGPIKDSYDIAIEAFRLLGSELVWSRQIWHKNSKRAVDSSTPVDGVLYLLRLSSGMSSTFSITKEVAVFISRHSDVQSRTQLAVTNVLTEISDRDVQPGLILTMRAQTRGNSAQLESRVNGFEFIWFDALTPERLADDIVESFVERFRRENLYERTRPVTADNFFGREKLLSDLSAGVRDQEVFGIFGLRKTGKTSVLKEFQSRTPLVSPRDTTTRRRLTVYFDLEGYDLETPEELNRLLVEIAGSIGQQVETVGLSRKRLLDFQEKHRGGEVPKVGEFFDALKTTMHSNQNSRIPWDLVLMLDEIEHFMVSEGAASRNGIVQFLQNLRKLVQDTQGASGTRFSFMMAGLTPGIVVDATLLGKDNPLFKFVSSRYLGPLDRIESKSLLAGIGQRMGMNWHNNALETAYEETGGSIVLLRELGGAIREDVDPTDFNVYQVTKAIVSQKAELLPQYANDYLRFVTDNLEDRYPNEAALLNLAMAEHRSIQATARAANVELEGLEQLGLVYKDGGEYIETRLLALAIELQLNEQRLRSLSKANAEDDELRDEVYRLLQRGESKELEFKGSYITPLEKQVPEKVLKFACFKTVAAFANTQGGTLLIGVSDQGKVLGLEQCIQQAGNVDRLLQRIEQDFKNFTVDGAIDDVYRLRPLTIEGQTIVLVSVSPSPSPIFSRAKHDSPKNAAEGVFVRRNTKSDFLQGVEMYNFLSGR